MSYTLVVVDMQAEFDAANDRKTIDNVKFYVRQAKKDGAAIIFLEYGGRYSQTIAEIANLARGYKKAYFTTKHSDDGSNEVRDLVMIYDLPEHFFVCGVNWSCCVRDTVTGMIDFGYTDIVLLEDACNQPEAWEVDSGWNEGFRWQDSYEHFCNNGCKILNGELKNE